MEYISIFVEHLAKALLLTLVLEAPVIWFGMGRYAGEENRNKLLGNFILINAITNITLNTFLMILSFFYISASATAGIIILLELIIPFVEAKMYRYTTNAFSMKRLLIICYIANAISFLLGSGIASSWG